jgi:RNA polymerase sigma factor (sigma-70 family)
MLNDLFVKILEKEKHIALRLSTARHLRNWCSRVIVNQMIDHIRREKVKERAFSEIAPLYDMRKSMYSTRFGESFDNILAVIQEWQDSPHESLQQYATLLKLHYVIGLNWQEVCDVMGLPKSTFYDVRNRAIERLKQELNPDERSEA